MLRTLHLVYGTFKYAALSQLKREETLMVSAAAGIIQGLKYTGSIKRGVTAAVTVAATLSAVNGIHNVMLNMDKIKGFHRRNYK